MPEMEEAKTQPEPDQKPADDGKAPETDQKPAKNETQPRSSRTVGGAAPLDARDSLSTRVRDLVRRAHSVFYSSATYAKRPDLMDLYSATYLLKNLGKL